MIIPRQADQDPEYDHPPQIAAHARQGCHESHDEDQEFVEFQSFKVPYELRVEVLGRRRCRGRRGTAGSEGWWYRRRGTFWWYRRRRRWYRWWWTLAAPLDNDFAEGRSEIPGDGGSHSTERQGILLETLLERFDLLLRLAELLLEMSERILGPTLELGDKMLDLGFRRAGPNHDGSTTTTTRGTTPKVE